MRRDRGGGRGEEGEGRRERGGKEIRGGSAHREAHCQVDKETHAPG